MARKAVVAANQAGVYLYSLEQLPWRELPRAGVKEKAVRRDAASGQYLGMVAFEPMTRSGLHQHLGTALSYFLAGSLSDYQGSASEGMAGINLAGATHDAISYPGCLLASRLEGPVIVPDAALAAHPTASASRIVNPQPERWPDINIPVAPLPITATAFARIGRRVVYDYAGTGDNRRMVALTLMPHAPAIVVEHSALTDWFVLAGDVRVGDKHALANSFIVIEPGSRVEISSQHGCMALCWAEGPARGEAGGMQAELYGF